MSSNDFFSRSLPMHELSEIGRYDDVLLAGLPCLRNGMMLACFHNSGTYPFLNMMLKRRRIWALLSADKFHNILLCTSSGPTALLFRFRRQTLSSQDSIRLFKDELGWIWDGRIEAVMSGPLTFGSPVAVAK